LNREQDSQARILEESVTIKPCQGILFVLSAPSGAGKTTLGRLLMEREPKLRHSISYTTRVMRPREQNGIDYHFISQEEFRAMIDKGEFIEWASVHDNYYGTAMADIEHLCANGADVLLDIDVQGAQQLRARSLDAVFVFIAPPNMDVLRQRLQRRDSDTPDTIKVRMENAFKEMAQAPVYDYIVINDKLAVAAEALHAIVTAERCRALRILPLLAQLSLV